MSILCNESLCLGVFPDRLKFSIVKPLYKKGEKTCITNYRPISLLTVFSKVLEKVMYRRLNRHLTTNNVLTTEQFGFRKGISTENATFSLTDKILKAFNKKMHVGGIFCDLAKAFDCVNHDILLAKLNFYGLQGTALDLFKSYLANRKQKVQIQTENMSQASSEWGTIEHGVPQGSILGPLLFIIYINDLPATINNLSQPILFADDTSVTITSKNISDFCSIGNSVLSEMNKWFIANKLVLNFDKTKVIKYVSNNLS